MGGLFLVLCEPVVFRFFQLLVVKVPNVVIVHLGLHLLLRGLTDALLPRVLLVILVLRVVWLEQLVLPHILRLRDQKLPEELPKQRLERLRAALRLVDGEGGQGLLVLLKEPVLPCHDVLVDAKVILMMKVLALLPILEPEDSLVLAVVDQIDHRHQERVGVVVADRQAPIHAVPIGPVVIVPVESDVEQYALVLVVLLLKLPLHFI